MKFKEAIAMASEYDEDFRWWLEAQIVQRLDQVQESGEVEEYSSTMGLAYLKFKVPEKYKQSAGGWRLSKTWVKDARLEEIFVNTDRIVLYHGDPDSWAKP